MQRLMCLYVTAAIALYLLVVPANLLGQSVDCDEAVMKADITALNDSGLSGRARLCLSDDGAGARLRVEGTIPGHAYTVWFFYSEESKVVVNRFDSALAERSTTIFSARVGGLAPRSGGSEIDLVVVDHGEVSGLSSFDRAMNVLTPAGKPFSAIAVFKP